MFGGRRGCIYEDQEIGRATEEMSSARTSPNLKAEIAGHVKSCSSSVSAAL